MMAESPLLQSERCCANFRGRVRRQGVSMGFDKNQLHISNMMVWIDRLESPPEIVEGYNTICLQLGGGISILVPTEEWKNFRVFMLSALSAGDNVQKLQLQRLAELGAPDGHRPEFSE
jgi:hypothetical protein